MIGSRDLLKAITAALNASPFADPVIVHGNLLPIRFDGARIPRKYARQLERELTAKFSARPVGSHAGDRPNDDASNPSPLDVALPLMASPVDLEP